MLDLAFVRENLGTVEEMLRRRGQDPAQVLGDFRAIDERRRQLIHQAETLKAERNRKSEEIAKLKKSGQDTTALMESSKSLREQGDALEKQAGEAEQEMRGILAGIPNVPHESVPTGKSAEENTEVRRWGAPRAFEFTPKPHWELGEQLGILDLERAVKLSGARLPLSVTAYTPCFRSEAGSYGKDVRGIIRQHQFQKVELVKFTRPQESYEQHERLTHDAEMVLQKLGLPYRVMLLCTGDMSAASAKTYDLEVWLPGQQLYREISSCSNFEAYQARRANIRWRPEGGKKTEFVHTLNGSGLAIGRTWLAILENYQQADGSVIVPEALRKYVGTERITA